MHDGESDPSVLAALKEIGGGVAALLGRHVRLATLEAEEAELVRLRLLACAGGVMLVGFFAFAILNAALMVLCARLTGSWEGTLFGFALFYLLVAGGTGWATYRWWTTLPRAFSESRIEFAKTQEWLKNLWPPRSLQKR